MTQETYFNDISQQQAPRNETLTAKKISPTGSKQACHQTPASALALLPFGLFLVIFVGTGVWLTSQGVEFAFYKYPAPVCVLPAVLLAVFLGRKQLNETIEEFIRGVGDSNIISMCMIFLLSGAFATVAKSTGGVDATVSLGLTVIPSWLLTPGFFIISAFIATAMGTSMGTNAAVAPIALGVAQAAGIPIPVMAGAVMSGSMFGDNLSIISDTTIAATRTQGCDMKDKFRENILIALPAAILCFCIYAFFSGSAEIPGNEGGTQWLKVLPYLSILVLAVSGVNVFIVLVLGTILAGITGLIGSQDYQLSGFANDIYAGFQVNQEIFLLSMLIGGLGRLMERQGGLAYITKSVSRVIQYLKTFGQGKSSLIAEPGIAILVSLVNICTANNTIAIVVAGKAAKEIARKNNVTPRRAASILDIYSCVIQGLIPYGAQALLLGSLFSISPIDVVSQSFYPMLLAVSGIMFTLINLKTAK